MTAALRRYRILAYTVGTGLLVLVLVGIPLQVGAHEPGVVSIVGPIHGALYLVYLAVAYDLARRARFSLGQLAAIVLAGLVPFLAFVVERRVASRVAEAVAAGEAGGTFGARRPNSRPPQSP